jgi:hypothetical protein
VRGNILAVAEVSTVTTTFATTWAVFSVIGGSLVGAVISAGVSFMIQRANLKAAKAQREEDRFETRKAHAYSFLFKMIRIHSSIAQLSKAMVDTIKEAEADGINGTLWQKLIPMGNLPPRVKFTAEEFTLLLSLDVNLFNEIGPYDDVHNSLLDQAELYGQKRHEMMERFGAKMNGAVGSTVFTAEELEWVSPRAFVLNQLAETLLKQSAHDAAESKNLLTKVHALFVKEFKLNLNPELGFKEIA